MTMVRHLRTAQIDLDDALGLLERELERFRDSGEADLDTVEETLYFLVHHGELPRYARERLAYRRLGEHLPPVRRLIDAVERRRGVLQEEGQRLLETVEDMTEDVLVSKAEFDARAARFLRRQRQQLAVRRQRLLPLVERTLEETDWQVIEAALGAGSPRQDERARGGSRQSRT